MAAILHVLLHPPSQAPIVRELNRRIRSRKKPPGGGEAFRDDE